MEVNPSVSAKSVNEFIAYAKATRMARQLLYSNVPESQRRVVHVLRVQDEIFDTWRADARKAHLPRRSADQKIFAAFFSVIHMPQHSGIPTKAQKIAACASSPANEPAADQALLLHDTTAVAHQAAGRALRSTTDRGYAVMNGPLARKSMMIGMESSEAASSVVSILNAVHSGSRIILLK